MPFLENEIGRKYDLDRWYYFWNETFPTWHEKDALAAGRIPIVSWHATTTSHAKVSWASIANGSQDAVIRARADGLKALGQKVMLIFHHEPEDQAYASGTPADYRNAFRHVVTVFRNRGATNVVFVWNLMSWTFKPGAPYPEDYYPGDSYVDWIAADGYNWYGTSKQPGPWRWWSDIFADFYNWGKAHNKPLMVAETGSGNDPADPTKKAQWMQNAAATIKSWPQLKAVIYFNALGWWFDETSQSLAGYKAWGADPYFNPRSSVSDTTPPIVKITNPVDGTSVWKNSTVQIAATASDETAVSKVEFRVNGTVRCTDTASPYNCNWTVYTARGTTNWIRATAYDAAGHTAESVVKVTTK